MGQYSKVLEISCSEFLTLKENNLIKLFEQ